MSLLRVGGGRATIHRPDRLPPRGYHCPELIYHGSPGDLHNPVTLLALFGLLVMVVLFGAGYKSAIPIGVVATRGLAILWQPQPCNFSDITSTALQLHIRGAPGLGFPAIVFVRRSPSSFGL